MALTLSSLPGLVDIPDSALASGSVCLDSLLTKISQNAKLGLVRPEFFYGEYQDGDTVPLPVSPADGYVYTAGECQYVWALRFGYNRDSGKPSAKGQLLLEATKVDQGTGKVSILKAYYVQGGQQTNTSDGILAVWTIAVRGRPPVGGLAMASQPAFTDVADSAFAQDAPVGQSNILHLSQNAKRAIVSTECFFDPGGALSSVSVAAAGSGYQVNDVLTLNQPGASSGKVKVTSIASGGGQLDQVSLYNPGSGYQVNDILTVAQGGASGGQVQVTAVDGSGHITGIAIYASGQGYIAPTYQLATAGGHGSGCTANVLSVTGYGAVTGVAIYPDPVTGSKGLLYQLANSVPTQGGSGSGCTINITGVTAIGYANGGTVPLPVSPVDGYTYVRGELTYFPFWIYTGKSDHSGPSGGGRIRLKTLSVNQSTGVVSCGVHYWDGHTDTATNDGIIGVLVLATRTLPVLAATANTFTDVSDSHFWATQLLSDSYLQEVNRNAKFANLRPEMFTGTYTNGQVVSLPTSSRDSYAYERAELQYLFSVANTGSVPDGDILGENFYVDPASGTVHVSVDLQTSDGNSYQTSGASLFVITIARRAHETGDVTWAAVGSAQQTAAPPPPVWLECTGERGMFSLALAAGPGTGLAAIRYQIQLADDAAFTVNLETLSLGGDPFKTWREPGRTRYCRAAAAYADSPWSSWTVFGTPAPILGEVPGGSLPARTYYVQIAYSGVFRMLFRVQVAAGGSGYTVGDVLSLVGGGGSNGKVQVGTIGAGGAVTSVSIYNAGSGYSAGQTVPTTGGTGTDCTIYIRQVMGGAVQAQPSGEVAINLDAGCLLTVASPPPSNPYGGYLVFASQTSGGEQFQAYPILGQSWTEPSDGLISGSGPSAGNPTAVVSGAVTDNIADYVIHQGTAPSGSGYSYRQINSGVGYTVAPGDQLEFDQIVDVGSAGLQAGIDFLYGPTGTEYRASASSLVDQNGISINPSSDLAVYANGQWYHRKFDLTALAGYQIGSVASALIGSGSLVYKGRLGNIRITNLRNVQTVIYASAGIAGAPVWTPGGDNFSAVTMVSLENQSGLLSTPAVLTATGPTVIPLTIQGASGQTADFFDVIRSDSSLVMGIQQSPGQADFYLSAQVDPDDSDAFADYICYPAYNPNASQKVAWTLEFGAEGKYSDAGVLSDCQWYLYDDYEGVYRAIITGFGTTVPGALVLGASGSLAPRQVSGGPEMLGFQANVFNRVVIGSWVGSEANARWLLSAFGFMEWGPGGSADQDVALFRNWAGGLAIQTFAKLPSDPTKPYDSDHAFSVHKGTIDGSVGQSVLRVDLSPLLAIPTPGPPIINIENGARLCLNAADGGALLDIAGQNTVTSFRILGFSAGDPGLLLGVLGDTFGRFTFDHAGNLKWGSGAALPDVILSRVAAEQMTMFGSLGITTLGDTYARIYLDKAGTLSFGPGTAAADANISRQSDGSLSLVAGGTNGSLKLSAAGSGFVEAVTDFKHSGSYLGFFGATPALKQTVTGSKGGNAALASLLTALAGYGLVIDSST